MKLLFENSKFTNSKLGAMFGLDARIALAIFGALSVITGAALYSAISHAKTVQIVTQAKEVEKAIEQYMLDTGTMLPISTWSATSDLSSEALITEPAGVTGWKGPYLPYYKHPDGGWITDGTVTFSVGYKDSESQGATCTKSSKGCYVQIFSLYDYDDNDRYNFALEKYLDGTANPGDAEMTGSFMYSNIPPVRHWSRFMTNIPFDPKNSPNT